MAIKQLTTSNTFQQWLIATQDLIAVANTLTDGNGATFTANTILEVAGTGSRLNVRTSGSINTLYANTAFLTTANITTLNYTTANGNTITASSMITTNSEVIGTGSKLNVRTSGSINTLYANTSFLTNSNITTSNITTLNYTTANGTTITARNTIATNTANINIITGNAVQQINDAAVAFSIALG